MGLKKQEGKSGGQKEMSGGRRGLNCFLIYESQVPQELLLIKNVPFYICVSVCVRERERET